MFKKYISYLFLLLLFSCNSETTSKTYITNKELSNGISIEVEKINEEHSHIGIFSKHDYGSTHSYSYNLLIRDSDISWNGGSGEPKHLMFCEDSIFLNSYKEKLFTNDSLMKVDTTLSYESYYEVVEVFQKHIDKRYFFNLLGDDYWVDISSSSYISKKNICDEYNVPNDGELSLSKFEEKL